MSNIIIAFNLYLQGDVVKFIHNIPSIRYCLNACEDSFDLGCTWVSYNLKDQICLLLKDCPLLDNSHQDYLSADVNCDPPMNSKITLKKLN